MRPKNNPHFTRYHIYNVRIIIFHRSDTESERPNAEPTAPPTICVCVCTYIYTHILNLPFIKCQGYTHFMAKLEFIYTTGAGKLKINISLKML